MSAHPFPEPQPVGRMKVATAALSRDRLVHVIAREGDLLTVEDPLGAEHVVMRGDVDLTGRSAALVDAVGAAVVVRIDSHRARDRARRILGDRLGPGHWRSITDGGDYYVLTFADAAKLDGIPSIKRCPRINPAELHERWGAS
jgi:hypothetical protein